MKRYSIMALAAAAVCCGCTTMSLECYTLNQIDSSGEYRTNEVLECLATVAADPDNLPSFALLGDGLTRIQDSATVSWIPEWARLVYTFPFETLGFMVSRSPQGQWSLSPVADFQRLEAMRCACQWVVGGPDRACTECTGILDDAEQNMTEGAHFGVARRLAQLPPDWLHVGGLKDVPFCARWKAHCGHNWVWVMSEGAASLNDFTLVLHDIATLDASAFRERILLVTLTRDEFTQIKDYADPNKKVAVIHSEELRRIKPEYEKLIDERIREGVRKTGKVDISWAEWMEFTTPYHGTRTNLNPAVAVGTPSPQETIPSRSTPVAPPGLKPSMSEEQKRKGNRSRADLA